MLNNVIDSIFSTTSTLTAGGFIVCLLVSLALGVLIAVCSRYRNRPSKSLSVSLVLLPMIVQTIIALVNGQLGAGIAVAGAFSLVRFRSAPASAREITSIFLAMAVGLATGMGYIAIAVILAVFVLLVDIALASINFGKAGSAERDLKIVIPESLSYDEVFNDISAHTLPAMSLSVLRPPTWAACSSSLTRSLCVMRGKKKSLSTSFVSATAILKSPVHAPATAMLKSDRFSSVFLLPYHSL